MAQLILLCAVFSGAATQLGGLIGSAFAARAEADTYAAIYAAVLAAISPVLLLLGICAGYGLAAGKNWARAVFAVTAVLSLLEFPVGSAFGLYWLRALRRKSANG